uniref:Uncharacterized protein n=1 Tax=Phlebotomus papatasi TaxID=29031 RepID=A0A1B0DGY3_PHLPP
MFLSIVHNNIKLSDVQRLQYLMNYVSGNALKLISTLELTDANYMVAWQALSLEYDDQCTMVHCHIDKFCSIPNITTANVSSFRELYATANSVLNSLDAIKVTSRDPWVVYLLLSKLDHETKVLWSREPGTSVPTLTHFMAFLQARLKSLQKCEEKPFQASDPKKSLSKLAIKSNTATVLATPATTACPVCRKIDHKIFRCPSFLEMSSAERLSTIRQNDLCRKCLVANLRTVDCTFYSCRKCKGHHNTLLHEGFYPNNTGNSSGSTESRPHHPPIGAKQAPAVSLITQAQPDQAISKVDSTAITDSQPTTPKFSMALRAYRAEYSRHYFPRNGSISIEEFLYLVKRSRLYSPKS